MAVLRTHDGMWDELVDLGGSPRPAAAKLVDQLETLGMAELQQRQDLAELDIMDGRLPHSLLVEIFTGQGAGTLIRRT